MITSLRVEVRFDMSQRYRRRRRHRRRLTVV